jgi:hypothetical protein
MVKVEGAGNKNAGNISSKGTSPKYQETLMEMLKARASFFKAI